MKVPIYILGFLMRFGPLHGYKLKQLITEQASDFARIKLPTIYYHLEKLQKQGFVTSEIEKTGRRPDRSVYTVTDSGKIHFKDMLMTVLKSRYEAEFELDSALFFSEALKKEDTLVALREYENYLMGKAAFIKQHRKETLFEVPSQFKSMAGIIFDHHVVHYDAELKWTCSTLEQLGRSMM